MEITLLTVVRNAEEWMRVFLKIHSSQFDTVLVVHDGACTDSTLEIAKDFDNVVVHVRPGLHNNLPHREWALRELITGGWAAVFDVEEVMSDELLTDLGLIVEDAEKRGIDGIQLSQIPYLGKTELTHNKQWRIFKHSSIVHYPEHPFAGIEGLTKGLVLEDPYYFTYYMNIDDIPSETRRRRAILRRLLKAHPTSPRRSAWEAGLSVPEEWLAVCKEADVEIDTDERPLLKIGFSNVVVRQLADDAGIVMKEELLAADPGFVARTLHVKEKDVLQWQGLAAT